ncbi:hypothetical protein GW17_00052276 [Ensete ventricosum]|nr:hypothetical protein GW17_00052276 [Ensete ventricosum]RZS23450.1 hypothetical protein BHM03_00056391 [Ensete ventricosum]
MHWVDAVGNSLGVCRELDEGIGSLPRWRKGVRQKKIETHWKIIGGSRKACRELAGIRMEKMKEVKRPPLSRYPHDGSLQRNSSNLIS